MAVPLAVVERKDEGQRSRFKCTTNPEQAMEKDLAAYTEVTQQKITLAATREC